MTDFRNDEDDSVFICVCFERYGYQVDEAILEGNRELDDLRSVLGIDDGCSACTGALNARLDFWGGYEDDEFE